MGEHAVVYGKPAIVAAVDKRMNVVLKRNNGNVEISAESEIPHGVGMGSSAALAVVGATALLALMKDRFSLDNQNKKLINEIAYQQEKINHGYPSGVDNTVITYGGLLWFKRKKDGRPLFKKLKVKNLPLLVLINTGRPKETTREMVENVKSQMSNRKIKSKILNLFKRIEKQTESFLDALKNQNTDLLKNSIKTCERCLEELGVVGKLAKKIIREIEKIGGAAKISGAGGLSGGSGILLCYHENPEKIIECGKKFNLETIKVKLGEKGVAIK